MSAEKCEVKGCTALPHGRGLCNAHYKRMRKWGSVEIPETPAERRCTEPGCERPHTARGLCAMHYKRALRAEWRQGREAEHIERIAPVGEAVPVAPLMAYLDTLGGQTAALSWLGRGSTVWSRWKRNLERAEDRGSLDVSVADEFCCRVLRVHPYFVWGETWWLSDAMADLVAA